ncbi:hypothetical protein BDL97_08G144000 [Sphagnum fallax]|nr:hypothetical protein BDL97_08G144000 [Sphagnum fallax]
MLLFSTRYRLALLQGDPIWGDGQTPKSTSCAVCTWKCCTDSRDLSSTSLSMHLVADSNLFNSK